MAGVDASPTTLGPHRHATSHERPAPYETKLSGGRRLTRARTFDIERPQMKEEPDVEEVESSSAHPMDYDDDLSREGISVISPARGGHFRSNPSPASSRATPTSLSSSFLSISHRLASSPSPSDYGSPPALAPPFRPFPHAFHPVVASPTSSPRRAVVARRRVPLDQPAGTCGSAPAFASDLRLGHTLPTGAPAQHDASASSSSCSAAAGPLSPGDSSPVRSPMMCSSSPRRNFSAPEIETPHRVRRPRPTVHTSPLSARAATASPTPVVTSAFARLDVTGEAAPVSPPVRRGMFGMDSSLAVLMDATDSPGSSRCCTPTIITTPSEPTTPTTPSTPSTPTSPFPLSPLFMSMPLPVPFGLRAAQGSQRPTARRPGTPTEARERCIGPDKLVELMKDAAAPGAPPLCIVDCRYPYEFAGGHIDGAAVYGANSVAINLWREATFKKAFLESSARGSYREATIVLHCEFSSQRAPKMWQYLRGEDRRLHPMLSTDEEPLLDFPELYLLEGGYKAFYEKHPELCNPRGYCEMLNPHFTGDLQQCKRGKLPRNRSCMDVPLAGPNFRPRPDEPAVARDRAFPFLPVSPLSAAIATDAC